MDFGSGFPSGSWTRIRASLGIDALLNGKHSLNATVVQDASGSEKQPWSIKRTTNATSYQYVNSNSIGVFDTVIGLIWSYDTANNRFDLKGGTAELRTGVAKVSIQGTTTLKGGYVVVDVSNNTLRIYEDGTPYRGVAVDLTGCTGQSSLWHTNNFDPATKHPVNGTLNLDAGTTEKIPWYAYVGNASGTSQFSYQVVGKNAVGLYDSRIGYVWSYDPSGAGSVLFHQGILVNGPAKVNGADVARKYVGTITGDGVNIWYAVAHNLNTEDFTYNVKNAAGEMSLVDVTPNGVNQAIVKMGVVLPAGETRKVVIVG